MPEVASAPVRTRASRSFDKSYIKEVGGLLRGIEPGQVVRLTEHVNGHRKPVSGKNEGQTLSGHGVAASTARAVLQAVEAEYPSLKLFLKASVEDPADESAEDAIWVPVIGKYAQKRKERTRNTTPAE